MDMFLNEGRKKRSYRTVQIPGLQARESTNTACGVDASNRTPAASLVIARQIIGISRQTSQRAEGIVAVIKSMPAYCELCGILGDEAISRIVPLVGQRKATGVAQHVRMSRKA